MTFFFVNEFVENGLVEFEFGNNVNCQIGLVAVALPEVEDESETVSISCDQVDASSLNPGLVSRPLGRQTDVPPGGMALLSTVSSLGMRNDSSRKPRALSESSPT